MCIVHRGAPNHGLNQAMTFCYRIDLAQVKLTAKMRLVVDSLSSSIGVDGTLTDLFRKSTPIVLAGTATAKVRCFEVKRMQHL